MTWLQTKTIADEIPFEQFEMRIKCLERYFSLSSLSSETERKWPWWEFPNPGKSGKRL